MRDVEYLYHYTNVEALASILQNQTIRFNSLDKMDDLQEQKTADVENIGRFCYVSSWTDDSKESIPMWNMYASLNRGVRIKLPKNPFRVYDNAANIPSTITPVSGTTGLINTPASKKGWTCYVQLKPSVIPLAELLEQGFFSLQAMSTECLYQVEYTNDTEKLYPRIKGEDEEHFNLRLSNLGRCKNTHWEFQKEWRYIIQLWPFNINQVPEEVVADLSARLKRIETGMETQPLPHYDMSISNEAFLDMEITMSPRISDGGRTIVKTLVEKFNPSATLKESELLELI